MKWLIAFLFLCIGVALSCSFTPKPVPVPVKRTVIKCVVVHPNNVQAEILKTCSQGFLLKHHIEKIGDTYNRSSETKSVTLYFEK